MSNLGSITAESLELTKESLFKGDNALQKGLYVSSGFVPYDLQAPAKNLYPTITPLRNALPRVQRANPGDAAHWRVVSSITGSGYNSMGWVPEGQRSSSMSYNATTTTAPYFTIGEEDYITFEAEAAAQGFEDLQATASLRLLQKTMRKEEGALLSGNTSLALGTASAPTLSASGSGATLPALTYSVIVVGLTSEGFSNNGRLVGTVLAGAALPTQKVITGNDGNTYTLNGGVSNKSPNALQAVTLGQTLFATTNVINGAVAYAWYVGAAGSETLQQITTINSATFTAPLVSGTQPAASLIADYSRNNGLAFDGLLTVGFNPANGAYVQALAAGTAGIGTFLTASGRGSVNEIDNMLVAMWNNYRLSPTVIYVNVQEQRNITQKCLTNASGPLVRYQVSSDGADRGPNPYGVTAGGVVRWYYNPFSVDGGFDIPVKVHPDLPPGTILAWCETLPVWYQSNLVPNVAEVLTRRDYYRVDWPVRTRRREFGVYAEETLAVYAPFGVGLLTNIGNG